MKNIIKMKYCILAAGIGSRNNTISELHKGLLPIQNIPMISHIIGKFDKKKEIIITVGHLSEQIKSYVKFVHSDRKIKFITIDKYSGKGTGPDYSLLQCKEELQCPFVFVPIDTFIEDDIIFDVKNNWIGVSKILKKDSKKYCLVNGKKKVKSIYYGEGNLAYNGIAGIYNYKEYWKELEKPNLINNEHQVTTAFNGIKDIELKYFKNLFDTGTNKSYQKVRKLFNKEIVFAKNNETIFIDNKKVVKYFSDEKNVKIESNDLVI
jgi:NDP-sugar pyrophosphorylase family protein